MSDSILTVEIHHLKTFHF